MTAELALGQMPSLLSAADVARYHSEGFLALPTFLTEAELAHWRAVTDAAVALRVDAADELSNVGADPYYRSVFTQASGLRRISAAMDALVREPRLGAMAAQLAAAPAMRLWNDQALFKRPYANATGWHLDLPYWSFDDRRALTVWIALDEASIENGCMWYLPTTHRSARLDAVDIGSNLKGIIEHYPEWEAIDSVPVPIPAGGAIWHNGLIAHAAGANMTNRHRRVMTVAFMPDGAQYNGKRDEFVLTKARADAMEVGDELGDDTNPLVWPQAEAPPRPNVS